MSFDVLDLGRMGYEAAWELQVQLAEQVREGSKPDTLVLVEHDPVLTLGASFHEENLLLSREQYALRGIEVVRTDRGGDVTYHGPGQLVAYPVFSVERAVGRDLHRWMRLLEEAAIQAAAAFGVVAGRFPPHTGVWVEHRKVCAIGVKVKKWVNLHGLALNCDNDLAPFSLIVPCGIREHPVTSLSLEAGRPIGVAEAAGPLIEGFAKALQLNARTPA